ncbi:MAG TPA: DNA polymerase Y family protein [Propionicimonas sp.]|uniref:DNA polymerase Y family protein n=1 Tax=Propionicimonas sp. TaxID=1955623 RepID=UPI002F3E4472
MVRPPEALRAGDRCLVLWFPGWPVTAWALSEGEDAARPVAVVSANRIVACSAEAAAEGVAAGQRRREAQSRCPALLVLPADEARDSRQFAQVVECIERLAPGVQVVRPGVCALRARGLSGYVGSEAEAAEVLLEAVVVALGATSGRVGIADGLFTALQAAYAADPVAIVPAGTAAAFLAPLPVSRLGDESLSTLLPRLGVHTLGAFAALDAGAVRDRFGQQGLRLHTLASGKDPSLVQPRVPPPELTRQLDFEPPLTLVDQVAFTSKTMAEEFIAGLTAAGLACTELRVELTGELDELVARTWLTPGVFEPAAVIDRVRWQLQAAAGDQLGSGIVSLRLEPVAVDALANHVPGLFGSGTDERVHHVLSRVQAMLGHEGVMTPRIGGGRWLSERQVMVPWGDRPVLVTPAERPWPGRVPDPQPAAVFAEPRPVEVRAEDGEVVRLDDRGQLCGQPGVLRIGDERHRVAGWAGPWAIDERAWDPVRHRSASRFQVVDDEGTAWLLVLQAGRWWAEARYD